MAASKKGLFHSELVKMGQVTVTVVKEQQASRYPDKPPFITLRINGEERFYNAENASCASFFDGTQGQTFIIQANGTRDEAIIDFIDDADPADAPAAPPARAAAPRGNLPPARQQAAPPQRQAARPAQQPALRAAAPVNHAPMGVTVGMAINNACNFMVANKEPFNTGMITQRASDILRIAAWLEQGHLLPKQNAAQAAPQPGKPAADLAGALAQPEPEPETEPEAPAVEDDIPF